MVVAHFSGETLDDAMRWAFENILKMGEDIRPTRGPAKELRGATLVIGNPLARISRTETRGKPFSCLGELCWYLAQSKDLAFISYYLPEYRKSAEGQQIFGGYGPRLFNWDGINQFTNVATILKDKPDSRRAVIQLFDATDILEPHKDTPCTCTMQFMIRRNRLHMITHMRSNDVFVGMPHDIFCFTMLQEIMARTLDVELGPYTHMVGSLHLYDEKVNSAKRFLNEGWQSTVTSMQPMPLGDPWPAIDSVLSAEEKIRTYQELNRTSLLNQLDPYWADLVRLLLIYRARKDKNAESIMELRNEMSSPLFHPFIDRPLKGLA